MEAVEKIGSDDMILKLHSAIYQRSSDYVKKLIDDYYRGSMKFETKVVGVTYAENGQAILQYMDEKADKAKVQVVLRREPSNSYDPNAIQVFIVYNKREARVGYISKKLAEVLAKVMDMGIKLPVDRFMISGGNGYNYGITIVYHFE